MSLTKCPECGLQISDKAITCPHCGYPLEPEVVKRAYTKPTKRAHRKLPNGFGSITEIKGRYLRSPFLARVCVGKTETGRPILRNLKPKAYFKTYNDAYAALVEYNKSPYDQQSMTVENVYDRWSPTYYSQIASGSDRGYKSAWKKSELVHDTLVAQLKAGDIRDIIDKEPSAQMKVKIKLLFDKLLDYAMEYELVDKNVSRTFKLSKTVMEKTSEVKRPHIALTVDEVNRLWSLKDEPMVDMMLIQLYTGLRMNELIGIRMENVHFEQGYFTAGSKTAAGKNRTIPIHEKIKPLFKRRLNISEWLFNTNGYQINRTSYQAKVRLILPGHRTHDFRKSFVTYATKSGMDEVAIKRIIGHTLDVTEGVYTERSLEWLTDEMNKLEYK